MKAALIFCATLVSSVSFASNITDNLCVNDSRCTPAQEQIADEYRAGSALPNMKAESLYQGGCYMISNVYSPTTKHHGYVYFRDGGFYGSFSFFYAQNPFENMTVKEARAKNPETSKYAIELQENAWLIETSKEQSWRYFVRQSLSGKTIVIGQWGRDDVIMCEMNQNF